MAKDEAGYEMVKCENEKCPKYVRVCNAYSFGEFDKERKLRYFCSQRCALAELFGVIEKFDRFMLSLKSAK